MARAAFALSLVVLMSACESNQVATASPTPAGYVIPWTPLAPNLTPPLPSEGPAPLPPGTAPCQAQDLVGTLSISIPPEPAAYTCQGFGVGAFDAPYVPIQPSPPPPLPAIGMEVPSSVRAGNALPYLVTLTADRNQSFDFVRNCPTYEEELFADITKGSPPLGGKHIFALNCGFAGTLAGGASVTFQMVFLNVPADAAPGKYTLVFMLGYWNAMTSYVQAPVTINR